MGLIGCSAQGIMTPVPQHTWTERVRGHVPWLFFVVFYTVFANLPYWLAAHEFNFSRTGLFCVQYAVAGLISFFVPRLFTAVLLFAMILSDVLCGICETYYLPVRECLENFRAVHAFSGVHFFYANLILLLALLAAATAVLMPVKSFSRSQRWSAALCLVAFLAVILGKDIVSIRLSTGRFPFAASAATGGDRLELRGASVLRLSRTPIFRLVRLAKIDFAIRQKVEKSKGPLLPVPSASTAALRAAGITSGGDHRVLPNLVLVMVESWGLAEDSPLRDALVQPYLQPSLLADYQVIQGTAPFNGATVAGEARELCGNSIGYYIIGAPAANLSGCLPSRLAALGYDRIALHGMSGYMFNRAAWYKTLGFQEIWFHDAFKREGLRDCAGAFVGTCDADIAAWIGRRLGEDDGHPYFIHWMTLNSHLPVEVPASLPDGAPCLADFSLEPNTPLCSWYQLVVNVHRSVAQLATENLPRPTVFVIVGDHAPPFGDPARRDRFSQTDVPYVILLPRSDRNLSKTLLTHNAPDPKPGAAGTVSLTP